MVAGVDAAVRLLPHVLPQRAFISEGFLAVQTLKTDRGRRNEPQTSRLVSSSRKTAVGGPGPGAPTRPVCSAGSPGTVCSRRCCPEVRC